MFKLMAKVNYWLFIIFQLCEGGPIVDIVRGVLKQGKRMSEEHIAFILHETVKVRPCFLSTTKVKNLYSIF